MVVQGPVPSANRPGNRPLLPPGARTSSSAAPRRPARLLLSLAVVVIVVLGSAVACGDGGGSGEGPGPRPGAEAPALGAAAERGRQLARDEGCTACHTADGSSSTGPTWTDLAGSDVELQDGEVVTADDAYLARSITDPRAQVVGGFADIMPTAYGELSDDQVADLVAYIRALS